MFELIELRKKIEEQDYSGALKIVDRLEELAMKVNRQEIISKAIALIEEKKI